MWLVLLWKSPVCYFLLISCVFLLLPLTVENQTHDFISSSGDSFSSLSDYRLFLLRSPNPRLLGSIVSNQGRKQLHVWFDSLVQLGPSSSSSTSTVLWEPILLPNRTWLVSAQRRGCLLLVRVWASETETWGRKDDDVCCLCLIRHTDNRAAVWPVRRRTHSLFLTGINDIQDDTYRTLYVSSWKN